MHNIVMLWMEKWKCKKIRIKAWWTFYCGWQDIDSLAPPWVFFVIKTLTKSLAGEHWWRHQSSVEEYITMMWSWKMSKKLWMGHGAWMGITWGNMEDGWIGPKHNSQNATCFSGICFKGSDCLIIKMHIG
jgi:hypothetical protein